MPFDPDAFLGGGTATAIAPSGFDPDAFLKASSAPAASSSSFDPNKFMADKATPTERLQSLAQVVAQKNTFDQTRAGQGSTPADDEAYIQAWKAKYNENPAGHSFWDSTKDVAGKIGPAIWGAAKNAATTVDNIVDPKTPPPADSVNIGPAWLGIKYSASQGAANRQAATVGLESGVVGTAKLGTDVFMKGLRGVEETEAKVTGDQTHVDNAANIALQQLKADSNLEHFTSNPYNAQTQPQQAAIFNTVNAGTQMAALPEVPGVSKAVQAGGDFIENGAYKALGVGAKLVPPAAKAVEVGTAIAHPAIAAAKVLGGKISNAAGMTGAAANPFTWFSNLSASQSGLFKAVNAAGDQLIATPLGQNAIDSVVANAPKLQADATAKNLIASDAVDAAKAAIADAKTSGSSPIPAQTALRKAQNAATAANVYSHVIDKGASVAQWIQQKGMAGMPSKLADAVSGTIQGGVAGGVISGGDPDSISKGAAYGGILSMLGAAGSASEGAPPKIDPGEQMPTPTADFPGQGPKRFISGPVKYPQNYPPSSPYRLDMPTPTANMPYGAKPTGAISLPPTLREAAEAAIAAKPQIAVIDGIPHDVDALAENLSNAGKSTVNAIRKDSGETFNKNVQMTTIGRKLDETKVGVTPSDQDIDWFKNKGEVAPSGTIGHWGYNEDKQLAALQFFEKGKGWQHYVVGEMTPQAWQAWQEADSSGSFFNRYVRPSYPIWRVHENIWPELPPGPREGYHISNVAPSEQLLRQNAGQADPNISTP